MSNQFRDYLNDIKIDSIVGILSGQYNQESNKIRTYNNPSDYFFGNSSLYRVTVGPIPKEFNSLGDRTGTDAEKYKKEREKNAFTQFNPKNKESTKEMLYFLIYRSSKYNNNSWLKIVRNKFNELGNNEYQTEFEELIKITSEIHDKVFIRGNKRQKCLKPERVKNPPLDGESVDKSRKKVPKYLRNIYFKTLDDLSKID